MAEIDALTVPAILPASVRRTEDRLIDGKIVSGYPTKFTLNNELAQQSWYVKNTIDLQTKITTVESTANDAAAAVTTEAAARTSADSALATSITTVDTKVGNISASGAVYLAAKSAPSGATAAYGWYLTAGSAFAGMEALALSAGGSAIGFTANQFRFTDAGTAQEVFSYSSGVWVLNSAVVIRSGTSGARQVITNENTKIYDSSNILRVAVGINI